MNCHTVEHGQPRFAKPTCVDVDCPAAFRESARLFHGDRLDTADMWWKVVRDDSESHLPGRSVRGRQDGLPADTGSATSKRSFGSRNTFRVPPIDDQCFALTDARKAR